MVDLIVNQDVQKLTYENDSFDVITSNQVFEHVPNDIQGFSECFRVLRKGGGALIFTVPLYDTPSTIRKAMLNGKEIVFDGERARIS
jgi:ubiquinone/menaquinone biosynthesis C-methylase UbiE